MPPPAAPARSAAPRPASPPRCRRVLIVEDDDDSREALGELCRGWGHECHAAAKRSEALALLIRRPPDAVVLDLMLPDGGGVEVLRVIRTHGFPVRVAVVTAASDPALLAEARRLQPDAFFRKPLDFGDLRDWLAAP